MIWWILGAIFVLWMIYEVSLVHKEDHDPDEERIDFMNDRQDNH